MSWRNLSRPLFANTIATLEITERHAGVVFEQPYDEGGLSAVSSIGLTD